MKIAVVVTGGLHPSGRDQVVPSWLALFAELARTHEIHAFALRHLPEARTYQLLGFTVHDLGRPSAAVRPDTMGPGTSAHARAVRSRSVRSHPRAVGRSGGTTGGTQRARIAAFQASSRWTAANSCRFPRSITDRSGPRGAARPFMKRAARHASMCARSSWPIRPLGTASSRR